MSEGRIHAIVDISARSPGGGCVTQTAYNADRVDSLLQVDELSYRLTSAGASSGT
jgi:hypothetical protein